MSDENEEDEAPEASGAGDLSRPEIVATARKIAEEYYEGGLRLTVRQMYYQFVARGLLGSGQKVYKRIVNALSEARLEGRFPMHLLEDRGRDAGAGESTLCEEDVPRALEKCADTIGRLKAVR